MAEDEIHAETCPSEIAGDEGPTRSSESPKRQTPLIWVTTYPPSTQGTNYQQLDLPFAEVQALITDRTGDEYCLHEALEELNAAQRRLILNHVSQLGATLVFVDTWKKERVVTVFGKVELAFLIWSTSGSTSAPSTKTRHEQSKDDPLGDGPELPAQDEVLEGVYRGPVRVPDDYIKASPVRMHDAWGRKFVFPFKLVQTWKGIHDLIAQAFVHVPNIRAPVDRGHYDLIDTLTGDIILASVWEYFVRPGMEVSLNVWPTFGTPPPPIPQVVAGSDSVYRNGSGLVSPVPLAPVLSFLPPATDQVLSTAKGPGTEDDTAKHVRFDVKVEDPPT